MKNPLLFSALVAAMAAASATDSPTSAPKEPVSVTLKAVIGSGRVIDDLRTLPDFTGLRIDCACDVELKASTRNAVTVRADDNIVPLIETRVVPGDRPVLEIDMRKGSLLHAKRTPTVVVEFRTLEAVSMRGSGNLLANELRADRFALSMAGSGNARIKALKATQFAAVLAGSGDLLVAGTADEQAYQLVGSGDVAANRLHGRRVIVSIAGGGDAMVNASELLTVTTRGSGDVVYTGSPRVVERIEGSGRVRRKS